MGITSFLEDAAPYLGAAGGYFISGGNPLGAAAGYGLGSALGGAAKTSQAADAQKAGLASASADLQAYNVEAQKQRMADLDRIMALYKPAQDAYNRVYGSYKTTSATPSSPIAAPSSPTAVPSVLDNSAQAPAITAVSPLRRLREPA